MFGDELSPIVQLRTLSYWTNDQSLFAGIEPLDSPSKYSKEHTQPSPPAEHRGEHIPPPPLPKNNGDHLSSPPLTEYSDSNLLPFKQQSTTTEPVQTTHSLVQNSDLKLTTSDISDTEHSFSEAEEEGESSSPDQNELEEEIPSSLVKLCGQDEQDEQDEHETRVYDKVMTGWDPVPPVAGQKRAHSPEPQTLRTKC